MKLWAVELKESGKKTWYCPGLGYIHFNKWEMITLRDRMRHDFPKSGARIARFERIGVDD